MQKVAEIDVARKQPRIAVPLPQEVNDRLEELASDNARPVANMASVLIQAAIELIDEQGFEIVGSKLRRVTIQDPEIEE